MKRIFAIFLLLLVLISCEIIQELSQKDEFYRLPTYCKTKLKEYDTLVFKNLFEVRDSFVVKNIVKGNERYALSGTSSTGPYAYCEFEYIMINNINDTFDTFRYNQMITEPDADYGEGGWPLSTSADTLIIGFEIQSTKIKNPVDDSQKYRFNKHWYNQRLIEFVENHDLLTINGIEYSNVQEFSSGSEIKSLFYDFEYGIVKFVDENDHVWTRVK